MKLCYRTATSDAAARIFELLDASRDDIGIKNLTIDWVASECAKSHFYVVVAQGETLGAMNFHHDTIGYVATSLKHRRQGIARHFVVRAKAACNRLNVQTKATNHKMIALLLSEGFVREPFGDREEFVGYQWDLQS
jgi:hypothetical protein